MKLSAALLAGSALFTLVLLSPRALAAPEDEVRAAGQQWIDGISKGDPDLMVALYAEDAILHGTVSPVVREGRGLIREYFAALSNPPTMNFVEPQHIRIYDNVAVNTGNYQTKIGDGPAILLRYSFVYHKVGDQWLIVDHHSSRQPEPAQ